MKIRVTDQVLDYEGEPLKDGDKELIWRTVFRESLNSMMPGDQFTADEKDRSYRITTICYQGDVVDLNLDDRAFLLDKIRKIYNPLVCGRAKEILEGEEPKKEDKKA
jgi:hypothetical protein